MNNVINEIIGNTGLTEKTKGVVSGKYRGYDTIIGMENAMYILAITAKATERSVDTGALIAKLREKKQVALCTYMYDSFRVSFKMTKGYIDTMHECMDEITAFMSANYYENVCMDCKANDRHTDLCKIRGQYVTICNQCFDRLASEVVNEKTSAPIPKGSMIRGIIGAIIGSLIGVALWILISQAGYISGWVGLAIAFGCVKGYELLSKNLDKKGIIISIVITVIMVFVACVLSYIISIYQAFSTEYNITILNAFEVFMTGMEDSELRGEVIRDLLIAYGLTALTTFIMFKNKFTASVENFKAERYY